MYAVIQIGSHQYKVSQGDKISIQKIDAAEGSQITFSDVVCVSKDDQIQTDTSKISVLGTIVAQSRGDKIRVYKKKRRKGFEKTIGHRQYYTTVEINKIEA
ncbi:MAG: 50S ribosomal protein L21 [Bdellovibrionota bacterium]|nr:50S ribosomal protein L21 [Deltaproteobacteria bacterium]